jgi:glycosyltransferase involved in cell wall biosynthesis
VSLLCEELVRRGHEVTLFATGDSVTSARLMSAYPLGYTRDADLWDWRFHETMHAAWAFEHAAEFDLIHSHAYHFALPFTRLVDTPVLTTHHTSVDPDVLRTFRRYPDAHLVATSQFQRRSLAEIADVPVVHPGIDTASFPLGSGGGDYLMFLGRMIPDKGPVEAVRIARQAGLPLVMAGPGDDYFAAEVAPLVDGHHVDYLGRVSPAERNRLLAGAAALLFPVSYPEPFGLVMLEAMACGTPVAATSLGAVPEIVEPGVTGHHAEGADRLAELIPATVALDRATIRERAVARFDFRAMVDRYEELYQRIVAAFRDRP